MEAGGRSIKWNEIDCVSSTGASEGDYRREVRGAVGTTSKVGGRGAGYVGRWTEDGWQVGICGEEGGARLDSQNVDSGKWAKRKAEGRRLI